ncbi:hypothetical protein GPECTOR_39g433 [Gonium pectorale]|uniref:Uncharacterized protein n=1 Tax=Gonium pectorale TaxID=33097 RepID=A0A150GAS9_GONPE|nr:hypothetical protein GPECTOR_39g433 [Gonium pectorale]|eukprot:KXZ46939.1 hypothetical protein GPECTOR_39g433 [Gonium pectorale]
MASVATQRLRPFAGLAPRSVARPCRILKAIVPRAQKSAISVSANEAQTTTGPGLGMAMGVALGALGITASRVLAEEVATPVLDAGALTISAEDANTLAASGTGSSIDQILVSILFGVVVLLLVIVTGGVAYINIKQFLDGRQESEDREREGKAPLFAASSGSSKSRAKDDSDDEEGEVVVPLKRASRIKKEKGKGFASSEFTTRR